MQILALKEDIGDDGEDTETDALLDDLELNEIERTAIALESHTVGRHLTAILKERYAPCERYHTEQWPLGRDARLLEFQMPIPGKRHEDVA